MKFTVIVLCQTQHILKALDKTMHYLVKTNQTKHNLLQTLIPVLVHTATGKTCSRLLKICEDLVSHSCFRSLLEVLEFIIIGFGHLCEHFVS